MKLSNIHMKEAVGKLDVLIIQVLFVLAFMYKWIKDNENK